MTCLHCGQTTTDTEEMWRWGVRLEEDRVTLIGYLCPPCFEEWKAAMQPVPVTKVIPMDWSGQTNTNALTWRGALEFATLPDEPHAARQMLAAKLGEVGDQIWEAMRKLKGWEEA